MKKNYNLLFGLLLFCAFYLLSCLFEPVGVQDSLIISASEGDSNRNNNRRTASRSETRGKCEDVGDCDEICEEIYDEDDDNENEGTVDECLELKYSTVLGLEDIFEILEDNEGDYNAIFNIEHKHFKSFLKVSVAPWIELTKDLDDDGSETILRWIAKKKDIATAIVDAYKKREDYPIYDGVYAMLREVSSRSNTCERVCDAIGNDRIGKAGSFWEIATEENNDKAQEIVCRLVNKNCSSSDKKKCDDVSSASTIYTACNPPS